MIKMAKYYQGKFKPKYPEKYLGDVSNIVYRSMWECRLMFYFDSHPDIIKWASEEITIPYVSPIDNKIHRYFPDFYIKKKTVDDKFEHVLIEVKPEHQRQKPEKTKNKKRKTFINEALTYATNLRKWEAAERFCEERGWKFQILSEKDLGIHG